MTKTPQWITVQKALEKMVKTGALEKDTWNVWGFEVPVYYVKDPDVVVGFGGDPDIVHLSASKSMIKARVYEYPGSRVVMPFYPIYPAIKLVADGLPADADMETLQEEISDPARLPSEIPENAKKFGSDGIEIYVYDYNPMDKTEPITWESVDVENGIYRFARRLCDTEEKKMILYVATVRIRRRGKKANYEEEKPIDPVLLSKYYNYAGTKKYRKNVIENMKKARGEAVSLLAGFLYENSGIDNYLKNILSNEIDNR